MNKLLLTVVAGVLVLLLAGCAARPQLLDRSAGNPAGIDLSGRWVLRLEAGAPAATPGARDQVMRMPPATSRRSRQGPVRAESGERSRGPAVHVFIENGKLLKITQTEHGLFISFDRAVVEEFTFGENRTVSLGPIEAQRVAGWEGPDFVVETMDDQGVTLIESWGLAQGGNELVRDIGIIDGDKELHATRQVFDRS